MSHRVLKDEMPKEQSLFNVLSNWAIATWQHLNSTKVTEDDEAISRAHKHPKREDRRTHARSIFLK